MRCPYCSTCDSQVKDSRPSEDGTLIRRRRICNACGARFTTFERIQLKELSVRKKDGNMESFNRDKLEKSIRVACRKRDITDEQIEKIVSSIQRQLETESLDDIVKSETIGKFAAESLMVLDPVAYIRFISVYKNFQRLSDFKKIISEIPEMDTEDKTCTYPKTKTGLF